jgi:long-chain fatty acid transport protein
MSKRIQVALWLTLLAAPAWAGNGHLLHGTGAVNSSMGGAGVALPNDLLGALNLNPALLAAMDGHRMEFSIEQVEADNAVESRVGPFSGRTEEEGDPSIIPAFGWSRHSSGGKSAVGMGVLGRAGFGVDYPQDPTNPILAPQPVGFGRTFSSYQMLKIPFVFAWQVNPSLAVGASLNLGHATLSADPAGFAAPDCSAGGVCFVPRVNNDSAMGFGAQVGLLWQATPALAFGASYASKIDFETFEWNSAHANPRRPDFGTAREIRFDLDAPATLSVGLGWKPTPNLDVALDGRWIDYENTDGFAGPAVDAAGNLKGLGWEDILVYALGAQYRVTPKFTLRAGYNRSENPIPDNSNFFSVEAPAVFEDHVCLGLGYRVVPDLELNLGLYRALENSGSGPFISPAGPVPGTRVTNENALDGLLLMFSFKL